MIKFPAECGAPRPGRGLPTCMSEAQLRRMHAHLSVSCSSNRQATINSWSKKKGTRGTYKKVICVHLLSTCTVPGSPSNSPSFFIIQRLHSNSLSFCKRLLRKQKLFSANHQRFELPTPESNPHSSTPGPHGKTRKRRHLFAPQTTRTHHFRSKVRGYPSWVSFHPDFRSISKSPQEYRVLPLSRQKDTIVKTPIRETILLTTPFAKSLRRNFFHTRRYYDLPFLLPKTTYATHSDISRHNVPRRLSTLTLCRSPHTTRPSASKSTRCREETHTPACSTHTATTNSNARSVVRTI